MALALNDTSSRIRPTLDASELAADQWKGPSASSAPSSTSAHVRRERRTALLRYVAFYNQRRPHTAVGGLVPLASVNNVLQQHQSKRAIRNAAWG